MREETGLEVRPQRLLCRDRHDDDRDYTLNLYWVAEVIAGRERATDDLSELRWFGPNELPNKLAFPAQRQGPPGVAIGVDVSRALPAPMARSRIIRREVLSCPGDSFIGIESRRRSRTGFKAQIRPIFAARVGHPAYAPM